MGWLRCIPLFVEMSLAQMLKLHLSFVKVSVPVTAGADDHVFLPHFSLVSKCLKSNPSTSDSS